MLQGPSKRAKLVWMVRHPLARQQGSAGQGRGFTNPVVLKGPGGLLALRIKPSNGHSELGPGFQHPHAGNPER